MKVLLSAFLLLISSYIYTPVKNNIIDVFIEEVEYIKNDYIKINNNKVAFYYKEIYLFTYEFDEEVYDTFDYKVIDNNIHIVINDQGNILYYKFDELGKKIVEKKIEDYKCYDRIKLIYDGQYISFIFSCGFSLKDYQKLLNICVLKIDEKGNEISLKTYGGYLNEEIIEAYYENGSLFVFLKRDNMSGGDFNNFGNYVLSLIIDEEITKNVYFKEEKFMNMLFYDKEIKVSFDNAIYSFDFDLNQKKGLKFKRESIYSLTSFNKMQMVIDENKLNIYDTFTDEILYEYEFGDLLKDYYLKDYYLLDHSIYLIFNDFLKDYYLKIDVFDTRQFVNELTYLDGISQYNAFIDGWNSIVYTSIDENGFNPSVDGEYEIIYNFLDYSKIMKVHVLEYQNVEEGGVYPLSYALEFSGTAFLDGKMIDYGHKVNTSKEYCLELYNSKKEKRTINFIVSSDQISFKENYERKSDYIIQKGQSLFLKYSINGEKDLLIDKVIIDDKEWKKYEFKNNILTIEINESEAGFKYHNIQKIVLKDSEENLIKQNIDEIVSILVLNPNPQVEMLYTIKKDCIDLRFNISNGETIRYLNIYSNGILLKKEHFKDGKIIIDLNEKNMDLISFCLAYELGNGEIYERDLFEIYLTEQGLYNLGEINISFLEDCIEEFEIKIFKNESINTIKAENQLIYERVEKDYTLLYVILILFIILSSLIVIKYIVKLKKKRKTNNIYALKKI